MGPRPQFYPGYPKQGRSADGQLYGRCFLGISIHFMLMSEPEKSAERRTLKSRPTLVLLLLIGSCYAFGYTIFRLLKGMQQ
jgi:hypothetical protein